MNLRNLAAHYLFVVILCIAEGETGSPC
jgi:hypothetical protein